MDGDITKHMQKHITNNENKRRDQWTDDASVTFKIKNCEELDQEKQTSLQEVHSIKHGEVSKDS